ncbi:MAG: tRNA-dihydrouridine synthase family protein, partial [Nanoarchaeota archaeon]|nr:tRNA-dihydrouridine synthase family protein [Nanoarchaeota archaeon]
MEEFSYMLAPIEDMTDSCFRTMCHKYGADLTFTELMRFQSLAKNNKPSWDRIKLDDDTPTVIQLIGSREQFLKKFLKMFNPEKGFKGFNLNLGCPAPNFVNQGVGCAMIKRITKTKKLADIIKDHSFEVSIKMRLGLNQYEKEKKVYLNLIDAVDAAFFIIH